LLFWGHHDISEQESTILGVRVKMKYAGDPDENTDLVQEVVYLLELQGCKFAGMNALHFSG